MKYCYNYKTNSFSFNVIIFHFVNFDTKLWIVRAVKSESLVHPWKPSANEGQVEGQSFFHHWTSSLQLHVLSSLRLQVLSKNTSMCMLALEKGDKTRSTIHLFHEILKPLQSYLIKMSKHLNSESLRQLYAKMRRSKYKYCFEAFTFVLWTLEIGWLDLSIRLI